MKKIISNLIMTATVIILAATSVTQAQDWPQFRGAAADCRVSDFRIPSTWPSEITKVWTVNVGNGDASPVLSGQKIYLNTRQGGNEVVLCLDAASGKELWKYTYPSGAATGAAGSHPGPRSTPLVNGGKVFTYGVTGILTCLDASTGKLIWKRDNPTNAVPEFFAATSPFILDGSLIIFTGSKDNGALLCLDPSTGTEKWKWTGEGPSYASPSVIQIDGLKQLIVFSESNLMSIDPATGKQLWKVGTTLGKWFYNGASPVIDGQTIYYTGQGSGTRAIKVTKQSGKYITEELWTNGSTGTKWNTPVLHNGYLYGFSDSRRIFCINAKDGKTAWTDNTTNSDFSTLVDCGQVLIGLPSTGKLIVFKPEAGAYTEIAKYKVSDTPVYSFPVISGSSVYVKDAESLTLYKL
ncbi:MAG: PQQ-binding-like beta-propeller repeat protein [Bacteroidales bacterium]